MIKNWTVKTKQIKKKDRGLIDHFNYLFNKKRASHYYSDIHDLNNSRDKLSNILSEIENRKEYRKENGLRGGGVSNYATSFVLSLPRDIKQPTQDDWKKIASITLKQLSEDLGIDKKDLVKNSVVVLHDESKSPTKSSHIHVLVGNVINGQVVKPISQYQGTYSMKQGFNKAVLSVLNENNLDYVPKNSDTGNKPLFAAREEKLQSLKESIEGLFKHMTKWIRSIRNNQKDKAEKLAQSVADEILEIDEVAPERAEEVLEIAAIEEAEAELEQELADELKITSQVEKKKAKQPRKRRTRTRTN